MQVTQVKMCRFASGLLQAQVAARAKIPWSRLAEIESGRVIPQTDEIERLSRVLGVPSRNLLSPAAIAAVRVDQHLAPPGEQPTGSPFILGLPQTA